MAGIKLHLSQPQPAIANNFFIEIIRKLKDIQIIMHIFETRLSGTISKQNTSLLCNKMYIQIKNTHQLHAMNFSFSHMQIICFVYKRNNTQKREHIIIIPFNNL
jgi:hypothetical protein